MILIDFSQVMISNIIVQLSNNHQNLDEDLIRHMVLSSLRMYKQKFGKDHGELVICCDGSSYWRREVFPHYKANRKKARAASPLDWKMIFDSLNKIRDEIRDNMPYPVLRFDRAEADDIIGSICNVRGSFLKTNESIIIISSDKDFMQLQMFSNVSQYSPTMKKFLTPDVNPARFKEYHILQGDSGDGVPNFLSSADTFVVEGKRQIPLTKKKLEEWTLMMPEAYCTPEMLNNYNRNKMMIDLDLIPGDLQKEIVEVFDNYERLPRSKILNYFIKNRLRTLTESIGEF
jgi:T4 RNase H, C terminal/5'-3' exonuclease, N-terminal resolvase-like domain